MRRRALGRTGLQLSELAIAVSGAGERDETQATIALALDRGVNAATIDAADTAGARLLADTLAVTGSRREAHVIARATSLVRFDLPSPHVPAWQAYPGHRLRAETEGLLATLGIDRLALLQLHAWCPEWLHEGDWLDTLRDLRRQGKIAGFGISLFDHDVDAALEAVTSVTADAVQLMYNIFDQGAAATLLPLCETHGVGVVVRSPLYYGALAPAFGHANGFAAEDWRGSYFHDEHRRETAERTRALSPLIQPPDGSVADLALRFSLSPCAVSTVAVGMRQRAHLEANLQAVARGGLDSDRLAALARHKWLCS